jgi:hypothetical protein
MRGFPVNGDPEPAELSRPPENPPPELGYRCAQGRRLDLVDNCFWWHLGDFGALANVRFAPEAAVPRGRVESVLTVTVDQACVTFKKLEHRTGAVDGTSYMEDVATRPLTP